MRLKPKVYDILMDIKRGLLNNEIIRVVTGDYGMNKFNLKLLEDRLAPYNLQNTIVRIMVVTPSGSKQQQDFIVENAMGGSANITLKQSLFGESGEYIAEFQIFDKTTQVLRLTTPRFKYFAVESLQDDETILASDEYSILQQMIADVGDINNNINAKIETHNTDEISHEDMRTQISDLTTQLNEIATVELPKKAKKKEEDWKVATLKNGWQGTVRYRRNGFGYLEVSGNPFGGVTTSGTSLFTLPQEYINSFYGGIFTNGGGSEKIINCTMIDGDFKIHSVALYQMYINIIIPS